MGGRAIRWEDYTLKVLLSALAITCFFTLWMVWQLADVNLPSLLPSALAQDTTTESTGLQESTDTSNGLETTRESTAFSEQTSPNTQSTTETTTRQTTPKRTPHKHKKLKASGGLGNGPVPLMSGHRCPKEYSVRHGGACYSR